MVQKLSISVVMMCTKFGVDSARGSNKPVAKALILGPKYSSKKLTQVKCGFASRLSAFFEIIR